MDDYAVSGRKARGGLTERRRPARRRLVGRSVPAIAIVAALAMSACSSSKGSGGSGGGSDTYTIGYIADTSGAVLASGGPRSNAVKLAIDEINSSEYLGKGKKLKLNEIDGASDPTQSITAGQKLVADKSVLAVMCCSLSSVAGPLKPIFSKAKTPLVVTTAVLAGLPQPPYIYRTTILNNTPAGPNGTLLTKAIAAYNAKSVDIVRSSDVDSMVSEASSWKAAAEAAGASVKVIDSTSKQTDFSGIATQVVDDNPDIVVDSMLGANGPPLVAAIAQRGYKGHVLLNQPGDNKDFFKVVGKNIAGAKFAVPFAPQSTDPSAVKFTDAYKAKYNDTPTYDAAQGYISVYFIAQALKSITGKVTRESLAAALAKLTSLPSPAGELSLSDGQAHGGTPIFLMWKEDGTKVIWDGQS